MTFDQIVSELKKLDRPTAARALRMAHGYSCIWRYDDEGYFRDDADLLDAVDAAFGDVVAGWYAIGFEPFYVIRTIDDDSDEDVATFSVRADAIAAAADHKLRWQQLDEKEQ